MKTFSLSVLLATACATGIGTLRAERLSGAGATFPAPLYQRWAVEYNKANPDVQVNYQSVGSGAGVKQFTAGTVDFGASDAAMKDAEIAKMPNGVVMIPATAGSVVLAYNLPGVKDLKLSREAIVGIFMGNVVMWNDDVIAAANPGVELPDEQINVAYRSDGSGTTFVFTQCLSAISEEFAAEIGTDKTVPWPTGAGGKGNEGVTAMIQQTVGTIGYVEYGYAKGNNLQMALIENKAGNFVAPSDESGAATLAGVELPENLRVWPVDPAGEQDYPFVTFTWLLLHQKYPNAAKLAALREFVKYGLTEGQKFSSDLGYIPLPANVVEKSLAALESIR